MRAFGLSGVATPLPRVKSPGCPMLESDPIDPLKSVDRLTVGPKREYPGIRSLGRLCRLGVHILVLKVTVAG